MAQSPDLELVALIEETCRIEQSQVRNSDLFQRVRDTNDADRARLLASTPPSPNHSYNASLGLKNCLEERRGAWPVFDLLRCQTQLLNALPEAAKAGRATDSVDLINATLERVKKSYGSLGDFLQESDKPALRFNNQLITHRSLHKFVRSFRIPTPAPSPRKPVVCIALANGPILAATCIATATYYTAAPITPLAGREQFQADVLQADASFILTTHAVAEKLQLCDSWVDEAGIQVCIVAVDSNMNIDIRTRDGSHLLQGVSDPPPNTADDVGIILFTSGTSGTKKRVPLHIHQIVSGVVQVIDSWALTEDDICLNMMPLYHV
jgi:acyl-CoA synthetase (AMP-forming)/AMP-acid ligase II